MSALGARPEPFLFAVFPPGAKRSTSAAPNAMVLPEPVCPLARMSRPVRASGIVAVWMGKGLEAPMPESTSVSALLIPNSPKVSAACVSALTLVPW